VIYLSGLRRLSRAEPAPVALTATAS
jgi:hypothetical protein